MKKTFSIICFLIFAVFTVQIPIANSVPTFGCYEMTGTGTGTVKTSGTITFKRLDNTTADNNNQIPKPEAGTNYSYTKQFRLRVTDADGYSLDNPVTYSDGNNGLGTAVGLTYTTSGSFAANIMTDNSGTNFFTKTSASPVAMDATNGGPWTDSDNGTFIGDFVKLQMTVGTTATAGVTPNETITFAIDAVAP